MGERNAAALADRSILQRLKRETQGSHVALERRVDLMNRLRTPAQYRKLLEAFYGLYCPLEAELKRVQPGLREWLPDIEGRMRTEALRLDLRVLGNTVPGELPAAAVPPLDSAAQQIGCLYVLEGSRLGGKFIAQAVADSLGYTAGNGGAFFSGYGSETGKWWARFRASVESHASSHPEDQAGIIQAANGTFELFEGWFREQL
jgi:heme oxygenase